MGSLTRWDFSPEFCRRFPVLVETGFGEGRSLEHALRYPFDRLYSVEMWATAIDRLLDFTKSHVDRVRPLIGESGAALQHFLMYHRPGHRFFFWLDAHFPGGDCHGAPMDIEPDPNIRFPLAREIEAIRRNLPGGDYCIMIDDLRLYGDTDWESGPSPFLDLMPERMRNLNFLEPFRATHEVVIDRRDDGYAIIHPSGSPVPTWRD